MDTMSLTRLFSSLLLDSAAKGTVLLLLAWLAVGLARRSSAALRHSIWCLAMVGLLLLPVASWLLPTWQIPILHPEAATVVEASVPGPTRASLETGESPSIMGNPQSPRTIKQLDVSRPMVDPSMVEAPSVVPPVIESPLATQAIVEPTAWSLSTVEWVALVVCAGWILGVILFGTLLLVGLWRTVRMRNRSVVIDDGEWPGMLTELRQRLGLSRSVELREHAESVVPLTWGIWRPVVLVPQVAREWAEPMRRAVLLHELAHVQRGDVACQVLGRLTCVLYWFHPLSWFALRQLRQEREQACDDAVVQSGEKASDYAEQLLAVARLCCAPQGLSLGVAMAEGSSLERRVKSLFDSARSHGPLTRRVAIASLVIGGAILAGLAPIQPTASQAEPVKVETPKPAEPQPAQILESRIQDGEAAKKQMDLLQPVFGKAKLGIQLGLAIGSLERTFPEGGRIPLWLFYRNVGDKELTFQTSQDYMNDPVTVTDGNGKRVQVSFVMHWMEIAPLTITLKPGEIWCIATTGLNLGQPMPSIKPVAGKYKLTYPQGIWDVNTTPQLRTDIPVLPSLPPNISPANPDAPPSPATPVGQMVETPNWSEHLDAGAIEFEIAPGPNGQPEARVLASTVAPTGESPRNAKEEPEAIATVKDLIIQGQVVDAGGQPIAQAKVIYPLNMKEGSASPQILESQSDERGEFRFTISRELSEKVYFSGKDVVWATIEGDGIGAAISLLSADRSAMTRIVIPDKEPVEFVVQSDSGQPLAGVSVIPEYLRIPNWDGKSEDQQGAVTRIPDLLKPRFTKVSDAEGRVVFDEVPRKWHRDLKITSEQYGVQSFSDPRKFLKLLPVAPITGTLSNGQAGVKLTFTIPHEYAGSYINASAETLTDAAGHFSIPKFPIGPIEITSSDLQGPMFLEEAPREVTANTKNHFDLKVIAGIKVQGRVMLEKPSRGV